MKYNNNNDTAAVIIAPQNDVLSPTSQNWDSVGASVPRYPDQQRRDSGANRVGSDAASEVVVPKSGR
jgi:hypothetical protein